MLFFFLLCQAIDINCHEKLGLSEKVLQSRVNVNFHVKIGDFKLLGDDGNAAHHLIEHIFKTIYKPFRKTS